MNVALIFAGGTGSRMNSRTKPKQFLELHGKPIIIYTIELFENHPQIDAIVVVCLEEWIPYLRRLTQKFSITKANTVVPGGNTGQESIWNGLQEIHRLFPLDSVVLVHDGVRPLIDEDTITRCITSVKRFGNAITTAPAIETILIKEEEENKVAEIMDRNCCLLARAPQCFLLKDLYSAHVKARKADKSDFIDSASMMMDYGMSLHTVPGPVENIKITTPTDYYMFRAITDARENSQIFGQ